MSVKNLDLLSTLVKNQEKDEFTKMITTELFGDDDELTKALEQAHQRERTEAAMKAAGVIIETVKTAQASKAALVEKIRQYRRQEQSALKALQAIEVAEAYGKATRNYVPLAVMTDSSSYGTVLFHPHATIPQEFRDQYAAQKADKQAPVARKTAKKA